MRDFLRKYVHGALFVLFFVIAYYAFCYFMEAQGAFWNEKVLQPIFGIEVPFVGVLFSAILFWCVQTLREYIHGTFIYEALHKRWPISAEILFVKKSNKTSPILKGCVITQYHREQHLKAVTIVSILPICRGQEHIVYTATLAAPPSTEGFKQDVIVLAKRVEENGAVRHAPFSLLMGLRLELTAGATLPPDALWDSEWVPLEKVLKDEGYI